MKNDLVVDLLNDIADMLEIRGDSTFKVRAYREAARQIENLREDVEPLALSHRLKEIPGIGESIESKVSEYVATGKSSYLDQLAQDLPSGLAEILEIPGVGVKKAQLFHRELGITSIDELEQAAREHKLRSIPGVQDKTEQNVLEGIMRLKGRTHRMLLGDALPAAEEIVRQLRDDPSVERIDIGGSIRRMQETIGDIDILVASSKPLEAIKAFTSLPSVKAVLAKGSTKASILTRQDLQIDMRVVSPLEWGAALQYFTGDKPHNIQLRSIAENFGLKLNEYGIFRGDTGERVGGQEECDIYDILEMDCMPPEMRQATGEIEAAARPALPDLIEIGDIKGDLHSHTNWSDGANSIEAMAEAAMDRGYEYLAISDHSVSMGFIHGLSTDRVREQRRIIDQLNKKFDGFQLLHGIEVNIKSDGTLDYDDDVLSMFDVVTASVHSGIGQPRAKITSRIIAAMRNPHVDIIGHPTGRVIGRREPSDFDADAVFATAAQTGTALEIDGQPDRLDLRDALARQASAAGAVFSCDSDAHSTTQLSNMRYAVATARRGWIERASVINALPLQKLMEKLASKKDFR